jgi:hypothetical protein
MKTQATQTGVTQTTRYTQTPRATSLDQLRSHSTRVTKQQPKFNSKTVKTVVIASALGCMVTSLAMASIALFKNDDFPFSNKTLLCFSIGIITGVTIFVGNIAGCLSKKCNNEQNPPVTNV